MDKIREQLKNPLVAGIAAFVIGLLIGWIFFGWVLFPVQWTDAAPVDLQRGFRKDYLHAVIDSYARTGDQTVAEARYGYLGKNGLQALEDVQQDYKGKAPDPAVDNFTQNVAKVTIAPLPTAGPGTQTAPTSVGPTSLAPTPTQAAKKSSSIAGLLLPVACVLTLLILAALGVAIFLLRRQPSTGPATPAVQAQQAAAQAEYTDYSAQGQEPPMAQFMASYKLGDDLFDDSFSVDSPSGEFLGECGVGISETIGVGEPKRVTAFEVWLFDKNDIQTVTKVIMSAHAFADEAIRQRLAAKGEPVQAAPAAEVVLETQTLQLVARVVDMAFGEGPLPPESFFDSIILELAIWPKA